MPYSGPNDPNLPSNVKKLPDVLRRQWVHVWDSVYKECTSSGGSNCDVTARIRANGVIKKRLMEGQGDEMSGDFFFVDLQSVVLEPGKAFDGMAPGEFRDMFGRHVKIDPKDFEQYVRNTVLAIEHTRTESGEVVGLPIDAEGHDQGDGAGFIIDAFTAEVDKPDGKKIPIIRVVAKWTEIGKNLIEKGIRRFFSPTVSTKEKVILGGSLTNWPASRDKTGNILLRPIELASNPNWVTVEFDDDETESETETITFSDDDVTYTIAGFDQTDESFSDLASFDESAWDAGAVKKALSIGDLRRVCLLDLNGYPGQDEPIKSLCMLPVRKSPGASVNRSALRSAGAGAHSITAVKKPGGVPDDWFNGRKKSAANKIISMWRSAFENPAPQGVYTIAGKSRPAEKSMSSSDDSSLSSDDQQNQKKDGEQMDIKELEGLDELIENKLEASIEKILLKVGKVPGADGDPETDTGDGEIDIIKMLGLGHLEQEAQDRIEASLKASYDALSKQAELAYLQKLAFVNRKNEMTQLATRLTTGTEESPRGIPIQQDQLSEALLRLPVDQVPFWTDLLKKVVDGGLIEFEELGNGNKPKGTLELPKYFADKLDAGDLTLVQLRDPMLSSELGDLDQYDLTKWQK